MSAVLTGWSAALDTTDRNATVAAAEPEELAIEATNQRLEQIVTAFAGVFDAESSFTFEHSDRVAARLGFSEGELVRLRRAAQLHDIGKLAVPNAILDKLGLLTGPEWEIVKQHPAHTLGVFAQVPVFRELAEDPANHHERIDGQGYFRGLTLVQLTPAARVLAVADVADALMSAPPYRGPRPVDEVIALLRQGRGTQFRPDAVDAMTVSLAAAPSA